MVVWESFGQNVQLVCNDISSFSFLGLDRSDCIPFTNDIRPFHCTRLLHRFICYRLLFAGWLSTRVSRSCRKGTKTQSKRVRKVKRNTPKGVRLVYLRKSSTGIFRIRLGMSKYFGSVEFNVSACSHCVCTDTRYRTHEFCSQDSRSFLSFAF
jgi:hypothetical protein